MSMEPPSSSTTSATMSMEPPSSSATSAVPSSSSAVSTCAASQLPRIRASRFSELPAEPTTSSGEGGSSVATGVPDDVVSPLSPTTSERVRQLHQFRLETEARTSSAPDASGPLTRLLRGLDVAEQCRWSGLLLIVFYGITVLLWPSLFVSAMGLICGLAGALSCYEPYSLQKIVWVFVYAYLNVALLFVLAWTAVDKLIIHGDDSESVNFLYMSAFVLLGFFVHVRSWMMAKALIVRCKLTPVLIEAVVPERWRPAPQQPAAPPSGENEHEEVSAHSSRSSRAHSFEIDIQTPRSLRSNLGWSRPTSPVAGTLGSPPSTPRSGPGSPDTTPFRRLSDAPM